MNEVLYLQVSEELRIKSVQNECIKSRGLTPTLTTTSMSKKTRIWKVPEGESWCSCNRQRATWVRTKSSENPPQASNPHNEDGDGVLGSQFPEALGKSRNTSMEPEQSAFTVHGAKNAWVCIDEDEIQWRDDYSRVHFFLFRHYDGKYEPLPFILSLFLEKNLVR